MSTERVKIKMDGIRISAAIGDKITLISRDEDVKTYRIEGITESGLVRTCRGTFGHAAFQEMVSDADMIQINTVVDEE